MINWYAIDSEKSVCNCLKKNKCCIRFGTRMRTHTIKSFVQYFVRKDTDLPAINEQILFDCNTCTLPDMRKITRKMNILFSIASIRIR